MIEGHQGIQLGRQKAISRGYLGVKLLALALLKWDETRCQLSSARLPNWRDQSQKHLRINRRGKTSRQWGKLNSPLSRDFITDRCCHCRREIRDDEGLARDELMKALSSFFRSSMDYCMSCCAMTISCSGRQSTAPRWYCRRIST